MTTNIIEHRLSFLLISLNIAVILSSLIWSIALAFEAAAPAVLLAVTKDDPLADLFRVFA